MLHQGRLARAWSPQNGKPEGVIRIAVEQLPQAMPSAGDRLLSLRNDARAGLAFRPRHEPEIDEHLLKEEPRRSAADEALSSKPSTFVLYGGFQRRIDCPYPSAMGLPMG